MRERASEYLSVRQRAQAARVPQIQLRQLDDENKTLLKVSREQARTRVRARACACACACMRVCMRVHARVHARASRTMPLARPFAAAHGRPTVGTVTCVAVT